jgi:hypothetical protein
MHGELKRLDYLRLKKNVVEGNSKVKLKNQYTVHSQGE